MIYPIDVHSKTTRSGKMTNTDKIKIGMGVLLAVNVVFTLFSAGFFKALGIPLVIVIIAQLVLYLFIFVMVFRFAIFREQDREQDESDVFMQYYKFRPGSKKSTLHIGDVDFFELKNNSHVCALQFKYGSNDAHKKAATEMFLRNVVNILGEKRIESRFLVLTESFMDTPEFDYHLNRVNNVKEPMLRASLLEIYSKTFSFTEENASCETIVLMMYAKNAFVKDDLEDAVVQIETLYQKYSRLHAFRKREYLDSAKLLEIFRQFFAMGAIDLSLSKIQLNATDPDILKSVTLYRVISEDGKSYTNPIFDKIRTNVKVIN